MGNKEKYRMKLRRGLLRVGIEPYIDYRHGYLWIGDEKEGCYGILDEHKAIRMARTILRLAMSENPKKGDVSG